MRSDFFARTHRRPTWHKAGVHEARSFRVKRGSSRRERVERTIGRLKARQSDRRNRSVHAAGRGRLVTRLEHKAPGRVEKVDPAYTSQTCHACGHRAADNRESQAVFRCRARGHTDHADVNAAKNIAVGRTVTARGALQPPGGAANRESQPVFPSG